MGLGWVYWVVVFGVEDGWPESELRDIVGVDVLGLVLGSVLSAY